MNQLVAVFIDAALPQKAVFIVLAVSIPAAIAIAAQDLRRGGSTPRSSAFISELRTAGPALGLLTASLDGFHMAQTILRLPASPTAAMLAPGMMEIASLAGLGAVAGLAAALSHSLLRRGQYAVKGAGLEAPAKTTGR